uniref:Uncharacterized protein n=1 Tax=Ditylenchus dipsaci TaxID=166011 RepID=A0A915D1H2_9BILA
MEPAKIERKLDELEALRVEAKNLRQRFEGSAAVDEEQSEEKKKQLEEEFKQLKDKFPLQRFYIPGSVLLFILTIFFRGARKGQKELEAELEEAAAAEDTKEDVQVAAEHASKMTAKWEKIHKKEAKKAQKGQMPQKGDI